MGRRAASEDNFRRNAGAYDVIHVAAHGVFDEDHPLRSRLIFHAPLEKGSDGWLQADEIRELEMHAALVVLSGCETGRGGFEEGEGAVGMAWAFLAAGSRAVLASQWRVESTSTTELMAHFMRRGAADQAKPKRCAMPRWSCCEATGSSSFLLGRVPTLRRWVLSGLLSQRSREPAHQI